MLHLHLAFSYLYPQTPGLYILSFLICYLSHVTWPVCCLFPYMLPSSTFFFPPICNLFLNVTLCLHGNYMLPFPIVTLSMFLYTQYMLPLLMFPLHVTLPICDLPSCSQIFMLPSSVKPENMLPFPMFPLFVTFSLLLPLPVFPIYVTFPFVPSICNLTICFQHMFPPHCYPYMLPLNVFHPLYVTSPILCSLTISFP